MKSTATYLAAAVVMVCSGFLAGAGDTKTASRADPPRLTAEALQRWGAAPVVFVGTLTRVQAGPVGLSHPPMRTHRLFFQVTEVLRGEVKPGEPLTCSHVVRGDAPQFPQGKKCVVSVSPSRRQMRVQAVMVATPAVLAEAKAACSVPLGWSVQGGKLVSPWAGLGKKAWPAEVKSAGPMVCSKTGRPALLVGPGVKFTVAPVPPKEKIKWTNPDGDGEYEVTVENTTGKSVTVPALLTDGKETLWNESLVILCQGKTYTAPLSVGVKGKVQPVKLKGGQKVSGKVNALMLTGPEWPRGGYRIEFTFCLGEKASVQSFYYLSRHHDKLREAAVKKLRARP